MFSDAYHFNGRFAKLMVQEIVARWRLSDDRLQAKIENRRNRLRCPEPGSHMLMGEACLVWTSENS